MAIDATNSATTANANANATDSRSGKAANKLASDMDMFLHMLTTQLRNQDPLSPMDSAQFTNQLVQFASVEQEIDANSNLERMIQMQHVSQMSSAVGYLGTQVEFPSQTVPLQESKADFSYSLSKDADEVTIRISDPTTGDVLRTIQGERGAGTHSVAWNGLDDRGELLKDGAYKVTVSVRNGQVAAPVATNVTGTVTGVTAGDDKVILSLSGVEVALEDIKNIKQPASPAAGA